MKRILFILLTPLLLWGCRRDVPPAAPTPEAAPTPASEAVFAQILPGPSTETPGTRTGPDPDRPMVALTFDDGPTKHTTRVLDLLAEHDARGTFFVIGSKLNDDTRPILQRMADLGCDIGMHGLTHTDMTRFSAAANTKRIQRMRRLISDQIDGGYEAHLLRPPFGNLNQDVRRACRICNVACIRWSVDTRDWSNKDPERILSTVKRETRDGAILLFHDRLDTTVAALQKVIPYLQAQGYELVTVTELIESSGQSIRSGEDYRSRPGG